MLPTLKGSLGAKPLQLLMCAAMALALAACGGGGGSPGTVGGVGGGTGGGTGSSDPKLAMTIADGTGAAITTLSGGQNGVLRATVTDGAGKPAASAIVTFAASDATLVVFDPTSASALTDAAGVAVLNVRPATVTSSGATSITATSVIGTKTATSTVNIAVGAAPLTLGTLAFNPAPAGKLPAFSTAALSIPVTSGGQPATSVTGLNLTSLCVGDGTATLVPGSLANGIQSATYTNNGCLRGTDVITASIGNSSQTIQIGVDAANIGTIQFVGSDLQGTSIVLKGSGGQGRKEAALVTFRVIDQNNNGLAGVDVNFSATTSTGGLTVLPSKGTTDATGQVSTTVSSGTIPTPVRVIAEATRNGRIITGLSDTLTISTGLPIQKAMSLSMDSFNIEGWSIDGEVSNVTVRLADQYGNPISDNTAINLVAEGGAIGSSLQGACTTTNGGCTVQMKSQNFRPLNGRVTVLAYVQGIENFVDSNGDGQYTCTNFTDPSGGVSSLYRPLVDICVSGGEPFTDQGDPFLDTGDHSIITGVPVVSRTLDGLYTAASGDLPFPYNHSAYTAAGNGKWGLNYIFATEELVFSGSVPTLVRQHCDTTGACRDWLASDGAVGVVTGLAGAGCASQTLSFRLHDLHNNPLPKDTSVATVDADKVAPGTMFPNKVGSTNALGGTFHSVTVKPDQYCAPGVFAVVVTTPKGLASAFKFDAP